MLPDAPPKMADVLAALKPHHLISAAHDSKLFNIHVVEDLGIVS